jgi:solute carrier family 41
MGLKGNLDMTLAARLSTQANLGNMSSRKEVIHMVIGNIAVVQVQATVAAFLIAVFALSIGAAVNGTFNLNHAFILTTSSIFTATASCFVLGK